jgi:hypothetical protein
MFPTFQTMQGIIGLQGNQFNGRFFFFQPATRANKTSGGSEAGYKMGDTWHLLFLALCHNNVPSSYFSSYIGLRKKKVSGYLSAMTGRVPARRPTFKTGVSDKPAPSEQKNLLL